MPSRKYFAALHDTAMAGASFVLALWLRYGDLFMESTRQFIIPATLIFTAVCAGVFIAMQLYRGLWRYASMQDLVAITKAVTLALLLAYLTLFLVTRLEGIPRSVPLINWLLLLAMLGGPRFLYRVLRDRHFSLSLADETGIPVLLVGANDAAELFIRDAASPHTPYRVVGIVDENKQNIGQQMLGVPIYGGLQQLADTLQKIARRGKKPQKLIITGEIEGTALRNLLEAADALGLTLARLPRLSELKSGESTKEVRPIAVEDLLGRTQNTHDREAMRQFIAGRRVLITGAGGTIGGELARQVASFTPAQLILAEISEYLMYEIDSEIKDIAPALKRHAVLCDVRDRVHMQALFAEHKPEIVFHAAAIKHVPIAEANVEETVLTNVFGTQHVADMCAEFGAEAMVMISTDKAVNPTSVMGASKRIAEQYMQALASRSETKFITVRFGNVLGSTGSVVPLFKKQLAKGGPLTVTHPDMVRFFMTVREAVELVVQAAALGAQMQDKSGPVFVLDMGQPVRIRDLAVQMIKLAGLRPDVDIKIDYTGLRAGEKLYEELFYFSENSTKTSHASIMLAHHNPVALAPLQQVLAALRDAALKRERAKVLALMKQAVPEFNSNA